MTPRARRGLLGLLAVAALYGLLSSPSLRFLPVQQFFPSYGSLLASYVHLIKTGSLLQGIASSLERMLQGYALGASVGIVVGLAMGWARRCEYLLDPLVQFVKFTPALAWLPLYILWFGMGQASMVMLIATGVAVVTLTSAYHGVRDIPQVHLRAARMLGAGRGLILRRVVLPAALPHCFDGLRVAIAVSWAIIVAAELIGAPSGLGILLVSAREYLNVALVLVVIAHIGLLAFVMDLLGKAVHARATHWMKRGAREAARG